MHYIKLLALVIFCTFAISCTLIGEFPAPRGSVYIFDLTSRQSEKIDTAIADYLHEHGFVEIPPTSVECTQFGFSNKCYRNFRLTEQIKPYVINVEVWVNPAITQVTYEFEEIDPRQLAKVPIVFSSEACQAITKLNEYVISIVGLDKIKYQGTSKCTLGIQQLNVK
ncbi:MAG: hypothetical protein ACYDCJ_03070 [Gammaproteobacteria bacterium]